MMIADLLYSEAWDGMKLVAKAGAQVRTDPLISGYATHYDPNPGDYVICTGYFYQQSDDVYYFQTTSEWWVIANNNVTNEWSKAGTVKVRAYSESQAQKLINTIIDNNKRIIRNNLLCARFASKLSSNQREQVVLLQKRLRARNQALQAGATKNIEQSYPSGYAELSQDLEALMRSEAVGVIGTAAWIVISCVVIAGMGTAAYYMYKSLAEESEKDVKFSDDLTRTLTSKLTEEEYQQLLQETKGIVTKAKIKQALGSYWNVVKIAAFAVAGYAGYRFIKNYMQQ